MDASAGKILADGLVAASGVALEHSSSAQQQSESASWIFPLLLSCLAGASTCVGAAVVFCFEPSKIRRSMAFSLSLAAAVMVTISMISILPEVATGIVMLGQEAETITNQYDIVLQRSTAATKTIVRTRLLFERLFSLGLGVSAYLLLAKLLVFLPDPEHMYLLDDPGEDEECKNNYDLYLTSDDGDSNINSKSNIDDGMERGIETAPNSTNSAASPLVRRRGKRTSCNATSNQENGLDRALSHETLSSSGTGSTSFDDTEELTALAIERRKRSWRVALMLFSSLLIHNFPEGLCVAASAKQSPELGITVAIGIFIHNVPEGIAISVPCIAAKPDRPWLAFWLASFSGLAEPMGAAVALLLLGHTKLALENVLAFVAGVMITVALWELYPEAFKANEEELSYSNKTTLSSKNRQQHETPLSWKNVLPRLFLRTENRPILWGTIVGTLLMVATELYLP